MQNVVVAGGVVGCASQAGDVKRLRATSRICREHWLNAGAGRGILFPAIHKGIGKIPLTAAKRNIDAALRAAWTSDSRKAQPGPFNQDEDFIFGSPEMDRKQPYWSGVAMQRHVRPTAQRA